MICAASWDISFEDKKRINIALSRPILIGQIGTRTKNKES